MSSAAPPTTDRAAPPAGSVEQQLAYAVAPAKNPLLRRYCERTAGKRAFLLGDEACAYGAIWGGCSFFGAYPITPASEIGELLARDLPRVGGYFVQMEDEIASIAAVVGSVWSGARAMTATSGPGFSLMQENIGYGVMTETPCVVVDVQRSGPSTGQATKAAQADVMQARWGTHGDHEMIALAPSSVQECFSLTIDSFNLAERYRTPVILLMDGEIGHLRENLTFPASFDEVEHWPRRLATPEQEAFGGELIPPMIMFGQGRAVHVSGSTHKANGMRDVSTQSVHDALIRRQYEKIESAREEIVRVEEYGLEDAEVAVVSFGAAARPSLGAVQRARAAGHKVGLLRLISIWPFARRQISELSQRVRAIVVPEMNLGQLCREVDRFSACDVIPVNKIGGISHTIGEIYAAIERCVR